MQGELIQFQGARIALQCSGHLRQLCSNSGLREFEALERLVTTCRGAADTCDLFVHTWDTLSAQTSAWQLWQPPTTHEPSASCVELLKRRLRPAAVVVERQQDEGYGNLTWIVRRESDLRSRWPRLQVRRFDSHMSLNGIRSGIRALARVVAMRQAHEQHTGVPYDVAIRIRPDLYPRRQAVPCPGIPIEQKQCPINQICGVPLLAWPVIANSQKDDAVVRGCDDQMVPGVVRSADMCYWSSPPTALDRLLFTLDAIADSWLRLNVCTQNGSCVPTTANGSCAKRASVDIAPPELMLASAARESAISLEPLHGLKAVQAALATTSSPLQKVVPAFLSAMAQARRKAVLSRMGIAPSSEHSSLVTRSADCARFKTWSAPNANRVPPVQCDVRGRVRELREVSWSGGE